MVAERQRPLTALVPIAGLVLLLFANAESFGWSPPSPPISLRSPAAVASAFCRHAPSSASSLRGCDDSCRFGRRRRPSFSFVVASFSANGSDEEEYEGSLASPIRLADTPDWKDVGARMILGAATEAGAAAEMIKIKWKTDLVVVTVDSRAAPLGFGVDNVVDKNDEELEGDDDNDEIAFDDDFDLGADAVDNLDDALESTTERGTGSSLITAVARSINERLGRDGERSLGYAIAESHEVEVSTPEFDNTLLGAAMFEAYKGFDVIVEEFPDPKKNKGKRKITEGKLVDRDDVATKVNVKGRVSKIKNEGIECVRLTKAKREKGVR